MFNRPIVEYLQLPDHLCPLSAHGNNDTGGEPTLDARCRLILPHSKYTYIIHAHLERNNTKKKKNLLPRNNIFFPSAVEII